MSALTKTHVTQPETPDIYIDTHRNTRIAPQYIYVTAHYSYTPHRTPKTHLTPPMNSWKNSMVGGLARVPTGTHSSHHSHTRCCTSGMLSWSVDSTDSNWRREREQRMMMNYCLVSQALTNEKPELHRLSTSGMLRPSVDSTDSNWRRDGNYKLIEI